MRWLSLGGSGRVWLRKLGGCDRPVGAFADGGVEGWADRGWQWDEDGLVAFPDDAEDLLAVFLAGRTA